jgi:hypothetical protein
MTTRTRYFVIVSLLVLGLGLGTGLVAYYVGFPTSAFSSRGGPEELRYVPRDAAVLAFANVQDVMNSDLRRRIKESMPMSENGQREFQDKTGINIETDIDHVVACLGAGAGVAGPHSGMVIATGRFDEVTIEALMREHGAHLETYKGKRLLVASEDTVHQHLEALDGQDAPRAPGTKSGSANDPTAPDAGSNNTFALAFVKPGVVAVGSTALVRHAVDLENGGDNVTTNEDVMNLVRSLDSGNNAWALGRFDALQSKARLPENIASQIPAITWFSVAGHVNGGLHGTIRAETRDEEAASNLRDVARGFLALGKLQTGGKPELQAMMQSLELGGTGKTVALSFSVPPEIFDLIGHAAPGHMPGRHDR